eukprot:6491729-Amphidinium_carterae.2
MTIIEGDAKEDAIRLQQLQDLEDDIQSIVDKEHYEELEREEQKDPEGTFWRSTKRTHSDEMEDEVRRAQARDRKLR